METRCPYCKTVFELQPEDLDRANGRVRCGECTMIFNARANLLGAPGAAARSPDDRNGGPDEVRAQPPADAPIIASEWPGGGAADAVDHGDHGNQPGDAARHSESAAEDVIEAGPAVGPRGAARFDSRHTEYLYRAPTSDARSGHEGGPPAPAGEADPVAPEPGAASGATRPEQQIEADAAEPEVVEPESVDPPIVEAETVELARVEPPTLEFGDLEAPESSAPGTESSPAVGEDIGPPGDEMRFGDDMPLDELEAKLAELTAGQGAAADADARGVGSVPDDEAAAPVSEDGPEPVRAETGERDADAALAETDGEDWQDLLSELADIGDTASIDFVMPDAGEQTGVDYSLSGSSDGQPLDFELDAPGEDTGGDVLDFQLGDADRVASAQVDFDLSSAGDDAIDGEEPDVGDERYGGLLSVLDSLSLADDTDQQSAGSETDPFLRRAGENQPAHGAENDGDTAARSLDDDSSGDEDEETPADRFALRSADDEIDSALMDELTAAVEAAAPLSPLSELLREDDGGPQTAENDGAGTSTPDDAEPAAAAAGDIELPAAEAPLGDDASPPGDETDAELAPLDAVAARPPRRALWLSLSIVLALALGAQVVHSARNTLATDERLRPALEAVYGRLDMPIVPQWDIGNICIEVSQFTATTERLEVLSRLANVGDRPQPLPVLRLSIVDRRGAVSASNFAPPSDYLPARARGMTQLAPGASAPVALSLGYPGDNASSAELSVCYAGQDGALRCGSRCNRERRP